MARSINDLAEHVGMTPKNVRKHVRAFERAASHGDVLPGKGKRYALDARTFARYAKMLESRKAESATDKADAEA